MRPCSPFLLPKPSRKPRLGLSCQPALSSARPLPDGQHMLPRRRRLEIRIGDQFCIYVCDRLVLPKLHNRLADVAAGKLSLDAETRVFIRLELGFRIASATSPSEAFQWEKALCRGATSAGRPFLNPHQF